MKILKRKDQELKTRTDKDKGIFKKKWRSLTEMDSTILNKNIIVHNNIYIYIAYNSQVMNRLVIVFLVRHNACKKEKLATNVQKTAK